MSVYWLSCATGAPPHSFTQEEVFEMAGYRSFPAEPRRRIEGFFRSSGARSRSLWIPHGGSHISRDADEAHRRYLTGIHEMAPRVARRALLAAGLEASELDLVVFASATGFSEPGYGLELAHVLGAPADRPVVNLLGMGGTALINALEVASDHLVAHPVSRALVVAAEVCSANFRSDHEYESAVYNALYGDGAAAVVLTSGENDLRGARGLRADRNAFGHVARIEGFRSARDGRNRGDLGLEQAGGRWRPRLARDLPEHILPLFIQVAERMELPSDSRIALHPGSRKILDAVERAWAGRQGGIDEALRWSRETLRDRGNVSSPSVAFVLERSFADRGVRRGGEHGAMIAMGSGLSVAGVRLRWLD